MFSLFEDEDVSRWVEYDELKENDFNLNIAHYVQSPPEVEMITVEAALQAFKTQLYALEKAEEELETLLIREGLIS